MHPIPPEFQSNPDIMKPTRMLMVDFNVCRFHSFDLVMWLMHRKPELIGLLKPQWSYLIAADIPIEEKVYRFKNHIPNLDLNEIFGGEPEELDDESYEDLLRHMMSSDDSLTTGTDIRLCLDTVFERPDMTGYLLRYPMDRCKPSYISKLTVLEQERLLDANAVAQIIVDRSINAVMLASAKQAVAITKRLIEMNYLDHMTFMMGRYGFNFVFKNGEPYYPLGNELFYQLELIYHHEYGYFDPYTGLTADHIEAENRPMPIPKTIDIPNINTLPGFQ